MVDDAPDVSLCAREPIHIPGAIQPHGVLVALRADDLTIVQVSDNVEKFFGITPAVALGSSLAPLLGRVEAARIETAVRGGDLIGFNPMRVAFNVDAQQHTFDCVVHRSDANIVVEIEPGATVAAALREPSLLRVRKPIARLQAAPDIEALVRVAAAEVQRLSGFDRAMIYRFDEDWHGQVIAEATSGDDVPIAYLGLHFPASDIPEQARQLYLANPLRLIVDARYVPAILVARPGWEKPLDLRAAVLRSVSPLHLEYLQNMGVRASMSISIIVGGRLWGLIACHHRQPRQMPYYRRAQCVLLGDMLAFQIASRLEVLGWERRAATREVITSLAPRLRACDDIAAGLCAAAPELLALFGSQGIAVRSGGAIRSAGQTPGDADAIAAIAAALLRTTQDGVAATVEVGDLLPDEASRQADGGALVISFSEAGDEYVMFFRAEILQRICWGGDGRKPLHERHGELHPRSSFARWEEIVRGRSLRWSAQDLATAWQLRQLILERSKAIEHDRAAERLAFLASHDSLTQLPNRAALSEALRDAIREANRDRHVFAVLFVDLDHFKLYNDSFGHAFGDRILQTVAVRLQQCVRADDVVGRLGGDEFLVVAGELTTVADAELVAAQIVATLADPIVIPNVPEMRITASVGIAVFPRDGTDVETLLNAADLAMYRAKERGRNGFARFTTGTAHPAHERIFGEQGVRNGVERNEFIAYYQPIVDLRSGKIRTMEALARWVHPSRGLLLPEEFISLAESSGAIVRLGESMLRAACRQGSRWIGAYGAAAPRIAVNVSPRQFRDDRFVPAVAECLAESGLDAAALILEVTEDLLIDDEAHAIATLRTLSDTGIGITIDDFGAGYSSLRYLKRLPVDGLKIDKSFIADLTSLPENTAIVHAIIAMSRSLSLDVIAEGVESFAPLHFLRDAGCDAIQGFAIERALRDSDAAAFIERFDSRRFVAEISGERIPFTPAPRL